MEGGWIVVSVRLTSQRWVTGNTLDQSAEHCSDTNTGTSKTDGGGTSSVQLSSNDNGGGCGLGHNTTRLHGTTDHVGAQVGTSIVHKQGIAGKRLSSRADDRALDGSWSLVSNDLRCRTRKRGLELTLRCRHESGGLSCTNAGDGPSHLACGVHLGGGCGGRVEMEAGSVGKEQETDEWK